VTPQHQAAPKLSAAGGTPAASQADSQVSKCLDTHHVFPTLHELLVNDLASIVFAGLDMYGLLDDGICAASKRASCAILQNKRSESEKTKASHHG
jgi:hypothetical protein